MWRRWLAMLSLVIGCSAFGGRVLAQAPTVLSGLTSVSVRVRLEAAARRFPGLDAAELDGIVRAGLHSGGLEVTDVASGPDRGQAPVLEILLIMFHDSTRASRYAFSLTATLTEGVTLRRGDGGRVWAQTWNAGSTVGIVGGNPDGLNLVRLDVEDLVDRFVRELRRANDRGEEGKREASAGP